MQKFSRKKTCFCLEFLYTELEQSRAGDYLVTIEDRNINGLRAGEEDLFKEEGPGEIKYYPFEGLHAKPTPDQLKIILELNERYSLFLSLISISGVPQRKGARINLIEERV